MSLSFYSTCCVHTVEKIFAKFFYFNFREYYWANYATGLGASLHELGHTFDLCHTSTGIMARGFDDIYRTFVLHSQSQSDSYGSGISNGSSRCSSAASSPSPYITHVSPFSNVSLIAD